MLSKYSASVGNLDELYAAVAPVARGFDPGTGAILIMRLEILIGVELSLALNEAKALGLAVAEAADLHFARADDRAPQTLIPAVQRCQPTES